MRYCFILGCSGSGKSLLSRALRCADGVLFANEAILPTVFAHLVNQPIDDSTRQALQVGFANYLTVYSRTGTHGSRLNASLQFADSNLSLPEFLRALAGKRKIDLFLTESNFFCLAPDFLSRAFPDAAFLFIVRDGRDCAHLLERNYNILTDEKLAGFTSSEMPIGRKVDHRFVPWWVESGRERDFLAASPYGRAIWMWKVMVHKCHDFQHNDLGPNQNRLLMIKYEDLVATPCKVGAQVGAWLQKPLNRPVKRKLRRLNPSSIGLYKSRPPAEIQEAERIAGPELRLFKYL